MIRLRLDEDIRPLSEFKENAEALLDDIRSTGRALVLTEEGRSAAVIVGVSEFEGLIDEL